MQGVVLADADAVAVGAGVEAAGNTGSGTKLMSAPAVESTLVQSTKSADLVVVCRLQYRQTLSKQPAPPSKHEMSVTMSIPEVASPLDTISSHSNVIAGADVASANVVSAGGNVISAAGVDVTSAGADVAGAGEVVTLEAGAGVATVFVADEPDADEQGSRYAD